ncbi:Leucine-rich repeat protein kinase family protein [Rhynchospora pubera]|uniref:non-specific serine/threonine protein kinase n=1 Tax=Rhynchospora pubera TaxID=906938 RepID=A0AAV8C7J7_9POAL|nr:Leucine-rich repeat protein kinase family protein [Rhynchospora pubera]
MGSWKMTFRGSIWVFLLSILVRIGFAQGEGNSIDGAALNGLASQWQNAPSNWVDFDPCGSKWLGVTCKKNRVISITLSSIGLEGTLSGGDIQNLSELRTLDLSYNSGLTGPLPASIGNLRHLEYFHFGVNQLSGSIPSKLFSPNMTLIHVLFEKNSINGSIPSTLGLVKSIEVLRLDRNSLTGPVPANLNSLTNLSEFHLAHNQLNGTLPDLTGMDSLSFVDMSNNSFDLSDVPQWFSSLPSLTSLYLEYLKIKGELPQALFSSSSLQTLKLRDNQLNGTLDIGTNYSNQLQLIDLTNNDISRITTISDGYNRTLILTGNPVCNQNTVRLYCNMTVSAPPLIQHITKMHHSTPYLPK